MTVEALLLAILSVFFMLAAYTKPGPTGTFTTYGPRLGARIENHLSSGTNFVNRNGGTLEWTAPKRNVQGQFQ